MATQITLYARRGCSDSCRVAAFELWPNCITWGQTIQSRIFIQNTPVEESYEVELTPF